MRFYLAPHAGYVSNFCHPNGPVIERMNAHCFQRDPCEPLTRVHAGHPVWIRLELAVLERSACLDSEFDPSVPLPLSKMREGARRPLPTISRCPMTQPDNPRTFARQLQLFRVPKTCIYCGAPADSRDHVPPRLLLEEPLPSNRSPVPACLSCNNGYSDDERYVRDALHHVGFGAISREKTAPGGVVARSLRHSPLLGEMMNRAHVPGDDGRFRFEPRLDRFSRVMVKIAFGLWFERHQRSAEISAFTCEAVEHSQCMKSWLVNLVSPPGKWPEVGSRKLFRSATGWPGQQDTPRSRKWTKVQPGIFEFIFIPKQSRQPGLFCIMNLYDTVWGVVNCPPPPTEAGTKYRRRSVN